MCASLYRPGMAKSQQQPRRCQSCGHAWWATPADKPKKPSRATGNFYELTGFSGQGQKAMMRAVALYDAQLVEWRRWATCPVCGSDRLESPKAKNFVPTAAGPSSPGTGAPAHACGCGTGLAPAWNFCPMCGTPTST